MPRIDILMARNLGLSRRQVTRLFREKRVHADDGRLLDDPKLPIAPADLPRTIRVDDEPVWLHHRFELLLHKPAGLVTAMRDDRHPTAYDLVRDAPLGAELRAVGRLDKETTGLLLWTTDGPLLHRLTHPRWAIDREYHVGLARDFADPTEELELDDGYRPEIIELHRTEASAMHPALLPSAEAQRFATIVLRSGKFHEVRRIFAALGSEVVSLCRVRFGSVELPVDLPSGEYRPLDLRDHFRGIAPKS